MYVPSEMSDTWYQARQSPIGLADVPDGSNEVAMTVGFGRYGKGASNAWAVTYDEALVITRGTFSVDTADGPTTATADQIIYLRTGTDVVYRADEHCELAFVTYPHGQHATLESEYTTRLDDFHPRAVRRGHLATSSDHMTPRMIRNPSDCRDQSAPFGGHSELIRGSSGWPSVAFGPEDHQSQRLQFPSGWDIHDTDVRVGPCVLW